MKELVHAQLVVEESGDRFAFRHARTRETMRAQLLTRERVALHRAIATAPGGRTRGERDAAALVALGTSNRSIARALEIGERTVEGYVAAALSKLDFSSRSQLAVWAAEQGLAATSPNPGSSRH